MKLKKFLQYLLRTLFPAGDDSLRKERKEMLAALARSGAIQRMV